MTTLVVVYVAALAAGMLAGRIVERARLRREFLRVMTRPPMSTQIPTMLRTDWVLDNSPALREYLDRKADQP